MTISPRCHRRAARRPEGCRRRSPPTTGPAAARVRGRRWFPSTRTTAEALRTVREDGPVPTYSGDLDPIDEALLRELAVDARASYADLGAVVSLSAPAVKRRVDRLRERGVVRGFTVLLDPAALGWATEAFVELFCHGSTSPATMRSAVERYPEV
ncbi:MAG: Lrp/AsnC family transcriptional regulator, partial [Micrococcales bacterium]|nr:Lrp/AsnC family transcriptional regulator [Micrococcales bacterium]